MTNFRNAIDLTPAAREELIEFCAKHLKDEFDATRYADALIEERYGDFSDAGFELRGLHTISGNPITIGFGADQLVWADFDADGNLMQEPIK